MRNIHSFLDSFIYTNKEPEDIVHDICQSINEEIKNRIMKLYEKQKDLSLALADYQNLVKQTNLLDKIWDAWSRKTLR